MKRLFLVVALVFSLALVPTVGHAAAVQVEFLLGSFLDNDAAQMASGLVYTYAAGTTTPKATYLDSAKSQTAANPIVLSAYGRANVYADGQYKFVIKTADSVTVATYDNLEFVSAVSPTTMVVTNLTVASGTFTELYAHSGTLASVTVSNSLVSGSRLGNCAILAAPTSASHPVNLSYFTTETASQAAFDAASLATHTSDTTDPHGTTLTQTTLRATTLSGPLWVASDTTNYPGFGLLATGATLYGAATNSELAFASVIGGTQQNARVAINTWNADPPVAYLRMEGLSGWRNQITVDATGSGTVDFGGAALSNFTPPANFSVDTATGAVLIPAFGGGSVTIASYTLSGISSAAFVVNWGAEIYHSATNAATIEYKLNVNGALVQTRRTSVSDDANFMVDPEWTYQGPLKDGDYITITLSCYSSVAAGAHGTYCGRYYIQGHVR